MNYSNNDGPYYHMDKWARCMRETMVMFFASLEVGVRRVQRDLLTIFLETGSATADDVRKLVGFPMGFSSSCFTTNVIGPLDGVGTLGETVSPN